MGLNLSQVTSMRPRLASKPPAPREPAPPLISDTGNAKLNAVADVINTTAAPFQNPPDPKRGTLGVIEHGIGAVMGVVGAPFQLLDTGFAMLTAPLAALMPGFPAATLLMPHLGPPHGHAHPPSLIPPNPVPVPLPSIGQVMLAGCVSVLIGGIPAARAGDLGLAPLCFGLSPAFEIYTGSSNTWIGGSRAARMSDITMHCNPASAMNAMGKAMGAIGVVAGAVSAGASATAGDTLKAAMQAAQAAADAAALAMAAALLGKDPGIPPTIGAIMMGHPTVLIGGFPMPDLLALLGGMMKLLKKLGSLVRKSPRVKKSLAKVGLCISPGEPIDSFSGVVYNDFEDYRDPVSGFVWERHYRSGWNEEASAVGYGFRHFYDRRLLLLRKQAIYQAHDGEEIAILRDERQGGFIRGAGFRLELRSHGAYALHTDRDEDLEFAEVATTPRSARLVRYRRAAIDLQLDYDERGRLVTVADNGTTTSAVTALHYDVSGRVVELTRGARGDRGRTLLRYAYNDGCLVAWQDATGATAHMRYDGARRMVQGTDRRGYSFHWQYDPHTGRCVRAHGDDGLWGVEARYEGSQSVFTEPDGGQWTFKHFADGVVSHRADPEGGLLTYLRDETDRIVAQVTPGGRKFVWFYDDDGQHYGRADEWGHQFAPEDDDPEPADPLAHEGPLTAKDWLWGMPLEDLLPSAVSLPTTIADALERLGPPRLRWQPARAIPEPARDAMGRPLERLGEGGVVERYRYDGEGNIVAIQDCHGHWSEREIVSWNLLGAERSALGRVTRYEYTHRQNLKALVDPLGNRTEYARDPLQRVREERRCGAVYRRRSHDANDAIVGLAGPNGAPLLTITANESGLPTEVVLASGETYRYEYDTHGRPGRASSSRHEVTLRYLRELRCADCRDGKGIEHDYESWLGIRRTTYFGRFTVDYTYGRGPGVFIRTPDGRTHHLHTDPDGVIVRTNANGTSEATVFDSEQRLCTRVCWDTDYPFAGPRWSERYHYSGAGELDHWTDSRLGPSEFEYDADHRLICARGAYGARRYEYDAAGNLVSQPGAEYADYAEGNRLVAANFARYEYDQDGRRSTAMFAGSTVVRYEYDSRGQLLRVTWNDRREAWSAAYDGLGRRLWRQYGEERTDFYWDGDRLAAERFPDGRLRLYAYTNEDAIVPFYFLDYDSEEADPSSGKAYYIFASPTGMPLRIEDRERAIVWQVRELDPYGRIEIEPGATVDVRLRFAGHYYDEHLGLHYNRFRDYDPAVGRYLQPDPIGHDGGVNLYAYPPNPLVDVDLRGLFHKARRKAQQRRKQRERREHKKKMEAAKRKKAEAAEKKALAEKRKTAPRGEGGQPAVHAVPGLTEGEVQGVNRILTGVHDRAQNGEFVKSSGYHGDTTHHFSDAQVADILSNPDAIHLSSNKDTLTYWKDGDVVIVNNSNRGEAITAYGKSGILGESGATALGGPPAHMPNHPGQPITQSQISSGTVPVAPGKPAKPPAVQIWP